MTEIIDLQPCVTCQEQTLSILELWEHGHKIAEQFMCRACQGPAMDRSRALRIIFEGLLADGVGRKTANDFMIKNYIEASTPV